MAGEQSVWGSILGRGVYHPTTPLFSDSHFGFVGALEHRGSDQLSRTGADIDIQASRPTITQVSPYAADVLSSSKWLYLCDYDRNVKLALYARAGIREAWLVVLPKDLIEVYSQPKNGKYQKVQRLKRGKILVSPTVPGLTLNVDEILG